MSVGAGGIAINFPEPSPFEQRTTTVQPTSGKDTKTETLSPEQIAARDEQHARTAEEVAFTEREAAQRKRAAEVEQQNVEAAQFAADAEEQARTGPQAQAAKSYIDWARQHTREEENKLAKMSAPSLFADRDGWGKVRLAVSLGLAGLGDGMIAAAAIRAGHAPTSRNTIGEIIDRDLARQRAAIDKQKDSVLIARTGIKDAEEARRAVMADIDLRAKHMYRQAELLTRSRLAALKLDQATIDQTKEVLDLKRKQADHDAEYVKGHSTSVTNRYDSEKVTNETIKRVPSASGGGGGVEADTKAAQFNLFKNHAEFVAREMPTLSKDDINAINRVMSSEAFLEGKGTVGSIIQSAGFDPETGVSTRAKEYLENVNRGAQALGRMDSGAAIGTVENQRFMKSLSPKNTDEKADLEMRSKNILADVETRRQFFGKPGKFAAPTEPTTAPTGTPPTPPKPASAEFTPERVAKARAIATDAKESRERRDKAREYIKLAAAKGVK